MNKVLKYIGLGTLLCSLFLNSCRKFEEEDPCLDVVQEDFQRVR